MKNIVPHVAALILSITFVSAAPEATAPSANDAEITKAQKAVASLSATKKGKLLTLVNQGKAAELVAVRGIGKTRAAAVVKARPFKSLDEVTKVRGIGDATFANLLNYDATASAPKKRVRSSSAKSAPIKERADSK